MAFHCLWALGNWFWGNFVAIWLKYLECETWVAGFTYFYVMPLLKTCLDAETIERPISAKHRGSFLPIGLKANRMTDWGQTVAPRLRTKTEFMTEWEQMVSGSCWKWVTIYFFSSSRKETILLVNCNCPFFYAGMQRQRKHLANEND